MSKVEAQLAALTAQVRAQAQALTLLTNSVDALNEAVQQLMLALAEAEEDPDAPVPDLDGQLGGRGRQPGAELG